MDEKNMVSLQRVPLEGLIEVLMELYDKGADFIDIVGEANVDQDSLHIIVRSEYIDEENNKFDEEENGEENIITRELSEGNIQDLIGE